MSAAPFPENTDWGYGGLSSVRRHLNVGPLGQLPPTVLVPHHSNIRVFYSQTTSYV
ncbi:hypothetical protein PILCRDRAFT_826909 [Piloderma croceum F 1598]|uniref:Uncharacterized protein n=1 Tax=Piloderma croceum (strain F 1598) TaxID=765440 RepID=A0A0C3F7J2_PILCF|nr:hypothetical protein PILCRDRAFT_826909 [Piloderma croceum F 1598]